MNRNLINLILSFCIFQVCNICYFAGESGTFKCPVCHNGYDEDTLGMESSSDTDC